ncbi:MAG: DUF4173 domain-containing protein [Gaiellaceae bacterium]
MRGLALAAALAAAVVLPEGPLGIGVPIVAALMLTAVFVGRRMTALRLVLVLLALALTAQAALLDATWVVALDLVVAWVLASFAASDVALAALAAPVARLREAPALTPRVSERQGPALRGLALGGIVLLPFLLLFLSADAAFAGFAGDLPLPSGESLLGRAALLTSTLTATLGLGLAVRRPLTRRWTVTGRQLEFAEWAIPLALLDLLFAAFVTVQLTVLFGGHDQVLDTAGLTYAEYARSGFWQLLTAAGLTFAVVAATLALARPHDRRQTLLLRLLLGTLCALTLVVLVSALHRLRLYEDAFGLTRMRLLAETVALWLGVLLALLTAAVWFRRARTSLSRAIVLATSIGLLTFSLSDPDRRVADRNVERWRASGVVDLGYLAGLSADAVPALLDLPARQRQQAIAGIRERLAQGDPWGSANRSRARARDMLKS